MSQTYMGRKEFNAAVVQLCGWTDIETGFEHGRAPNGIRCPIPDVSRDLAIAWQILKHLNETNRPAFEAIHDLHLTDERLFLMHASDAAEEICQAFYNIVMDKPVVVVDDDEGDCG